MEKSKGRLKQSVIPGVEEAQAAEMAKKIDDANAKLSKSMDQLVDLRNIESKKNTLVNLILLEGAVRALIEIVPVSRGIGTVSLMRTMLKDNVKEKIAVKFTARVKTVDESGFIDKSTRDKTVSSKTFSPIKWEDFDENIDDESLEFGDETISNGLPRNAEQDKEALPAGHRKDIDG